MGMKQFEVGSRSRSAREGGWLGVKRNYRCRKCDARFQVDTLNPLPEDERLCPDCRGDWVRSDCPICGRGYPHKRGYDPITCGNFDCLQEANKRGLLPAR